MTRFNFNYICELLLVSPSIALENEDVRQVLKDDEGFNYPENETRLLEILLYDF